MENRKRITPLDIGKGMRVSDLLKEYGKGVFGGGKLAEAVDVYVEMLEMDATVFLGLAGAVVPAGLGKVVADLVRDDMVDVIVSTGANVTHDLIEAFGGSHLKGICGKDAELRGRGIDRIYDAFIEDDSFLLFEREIQKILRDVKGTISVSDLLKEIGGRIRAEESFVRQAYLKDVPVFVPAFTDSILGLQIFLFSQENDVQLDHVSDIGKIIGLTSENAGAVLLGGGVPKNFIFQSMLMSSHSFRYAVQVTMDRPEFGGLSGATLEEAISWGKVGESARLCSVYCDVTIAFPLMVAGVRDRWGGRGGRVKKGL